MINLRESLVAASALAIGIGAAGCCTLCSPEPGEAAPATAETAFVPSWARSAVWYQVFPERFRNGDPTNDPTLADTVGAGRPVPVREWRITPWTSDWYELQSWERARGGGFFGNVFDRRYGGDLQGVLDKLDYLRDLGINAIYLNPIFDAPSLHKYDGASYHHVDPNFGPDPRGDRTLMAGEKPADPATWVWTSADRLALKLIEEAHARGMRVIFDGVFNHMGATSWPFRDVVEKQAASPYRDWFNIKSWDDPVKGTRFDYDGWFGVKDLPELREDANGIVQGPQQYIYAATRRWMDPTGKGDVSKGIDGWRLDVAFCVAHPFWKDWRKHVKAINPDAYLTAEVVEPVEKVKPYLQGDEFDAVMNYNFAFACAEFFAQTTHRITASQLDTRLAELRAGFDPAVAYVQQNLLDSHDTNRIATHIVNRDRLDYRNWGEQFGKSKADSPGMQVRKPTADEYATQKLMAIFQMTYVGAPMIYYGDEAGMWGANDPCCRKPMVWPEMQYSAEAFLPDGTRRANPDPVAFDAAMHAHYRKLIYLRNEHPALSVGDYETILADDARGLFAFRRSHAGETIIVVVNNGSQPATVTLDASGTWADLLDDRRPHRARVDGRLEVEVRGKWGAMLAAD